MFASCSGTSKEQVSGNLIRAKKSIIYCWFLYTCFTFSCILLQLYVCFSVSGQFWKKIEEMSSNGSKTCKFGKVLCSKTILGRLVDRYRLTIFGSERASWRWPLASQHQQSSNCVKASFFGFAEMGNLTNTVPNPFDYLRTSKTHP